MPKLVLAGDEDSLGAHFAVTVAVSERAGIRKMLPVVVHARRPHDVVGGDVHMATV